VSLVRTAIGLEVQLDQMAQQNSAPVEPSAAAAGSRQHRARRLSSSVGTFRVAAR